VSMGASFLFCRNYGASVAACQFGTQVSQYPTFNTPLLENQARAL
jgi:hypothetical protein